MKAIKTEHAGAKNGGGYAGHRVDAKQVSRKLRRAGDRVDLAEVEAEMEAGLWPEQCGCGWQSCPWDNAGKVVEL